MGKVKFGVKDAKAAASAESGFSDYAGPIPPKGVYEGVLKTVNLKVSKSGHPMIFAVVELDSKDKKKAKYNGYPVMTNVVIMDKTLGMVNQFLDALAGSTAKGKRVRKLFWEDGIVVLKGEAADSNLGEIEVGKIGSIGGIKMTGKNRIILSGEPSEYNGNTRFEQKQWIVPSDEMDEDDDLDEDDLDDDDEYDEDDDGDEEDGDEEDGDDASDDDEADEEDDTEDDDDDDDDYDDEDEDDEPEPEPEPVKSKKKDKKGKKKKPF